MGNSSKSLRAAIIGGGVAGVICAKKLHSLGVTPVIFEKSRGLGGRLATRRTETQLHFDLGAQYFTLRDPEVTAFLADHGAQDKITAWSPKPYTNDSVKRIDTEKYVGAPNMNTWLKHLAIGLETHSNTRIAKVIEADMLCTLEFEPTKATNLEPSSPPSQFDYTVVTAPPPQIGDLIGHNHVLCAGLKGVDMAPCWTLMLGVSQSTAKFDLYTSETQAVSWLARNMSKPGRPDSALQTWVAQTSPTWSEANLEISADEALAELLPWICETIGASAHDVAYKTAHRWRYSRVMRAANQACISQPESKIILAGDWCLGPRVECAAQSGLAAAANIAARENL